MNVPLKNADRQLKPGREIRLETNKSAYDNKQNY